MRADATFPESNFNLSRAATRNVSMIQIHRFTPRSGDTRRRVPFRLSPLTCTLLGLGAAFGGGPATAFAQSEPQLQPQPQLQVQPQSQPQTQSQPQSHPQSQPQSQTQTQPSQTQLAPQSPSQPQVQNLPTVTVSADRGSDPVNTERISAGALGERKQVDTPFSTNVKSSEEIKDLMAGTANDVFKYDPAVVVIGDNATSENSTFSVRGLQID